MGENEKRIIFFYRTVLSFSLRERSFGVNYNWLMTGVGEKEAVETEVDERLIEWLRRNPDVVVELKVRSGRKEK